MITSINLLRQSLRVITLWRSMHKLLKVALIADTDRFNSPAVHEVAKPHYVRKIRLNNLAQKIRTTILLSAMSTQTSMSPIAESVVELQASEVTQTSTASFKMRMKKTFCQISAQSSVILFITAGCLQILTASNIIGRITNF